jgi:hypothetical protein
MKLSELRELREAATPGPWYVEGNSVFTTEPRDQYVVEEVADVVTDARTPRDADARLIALAPDLARLVEELGEALQALHERVEMDESVGICLSSRVESLNAGSALAKLEALGK